MCTGSGQTSRIHEVQKARYGFSWVLHHQVWLKHTIHTVENSVSNVQGQKLEKVTQNTSKSQYKGSLKDQW